MGTSSDPRLSKKVGRFYCGRFAVRTLRIQDATDRMTAWLSDPEALEILNVPARRLTKTDIANHIRGFDQRTHLLGGIFDRSNNMLVGILQLDIDYRLNRALVNLLIGEPAYRNLGVTTEIFIPALDYGFINFGIDVMVANVLLRHSTLVRYLMKTGWKMDPKAKGQIKNTNFNVAPVNATVAAFSPFFAGKNLATPNFAFSDRTYPDGFMGGGQIGYNWQLSPIWVAGLEADFQGALERANSNLSNPFSTTTTGGVTTLTVTGASVTNYTTQIDWFGTVRGRLGYVWGNGEVMSYLTGGLAYGEVKIHGTNTVSGFLNNTPEFSVIQTFGHSQVNTGWVVGYGTEGHLTGNWTWKIEGLYMDLGHVDTVGVTSGVFISDVTSKATGGGVTSNSHFTDGILRAGLNYKFY